REVLEPEPSSPLERNRQRNQPSPANPLIPLEEMNRVPAMAGAVPDTVPGTASSFRLPLPLAKGHLGRRR
ncbi:MAG: hypothetical protein WA510_00580, partial [Acidobacteriaceae bacterium]